MLGFIMAGCKKEAGVLRVETNSIQNQTGSLHYGFVSFPIITESTIKPLIL